MTKVQLKNQVNTLMSESKVTQKFASAMKELLEQYAASANKSVDKRRTDIIVDDIEYRWCNRHEVYEVTTNFKAKSKDCKLAVKHWNVLGSAVNAANDARENAIEEQKYDLLPELTHELKEAKELRAGRYNLEDNKLQHAEVADYDYEIEIIAEDPEA